MQQLVASTPTWADVALVFIAVGQAALFIWQLDLMRKNIKDAQRAANAATASATAARDAADVARDSVRLAENTAKRQLRAYVFVSQIDPQKPPEGVSPVVVPYRYIVRNSGQTPAYDVQTHIRIKFAHYPLGADELPEQDAVFESKTVVEPDGKVYITTDPVFATLKEDVIRGLARDTARLYVYGIIRYRDAFGDTHTSRFRMMRLPKLHELGACSEGNEAD